MIPTNYIYVEVRDSIITGRSESLCSSYLIHTSAWLRHEQR